MRHSPADQTSEWHVASLIVRALPEQAERVAERIAALPGAVVHAGEGGTLVVTLEGDGTRRLTASIDAIAVLEGVLAATLVYHHAEPLEEEEPR